MSTTNFKKCNNCGAIHGAQDVFCGTCGNQFSPTGENYTTPPFAGLQQSPITPNLYDINFTAPTHTQPPPRSRRGKAYLIILPILALVLIGAGILLGMRLGTSNNPSSSSNLSGNIPASSDPTANVATSTLTTMPSPTQIATPSPTQASVPAPGTILYQENGSDNWQGWALSSDWKVVTQGLLVSTAAGNRPSAVAPYSVEGLQNFAVEARMRKPDGLTLWFEFGVTACGSTQGDWQGYSAGIANDYASVVAFIHRTNDNLGSPAFDPGKDWHTYRIEVKGNDLTFLIDNAPVVHVTDNTFLTCGSQVGFWNGGPQASTLDVSSFKVIAL